MKVKISVLIIISAIIYGLVFFSSADGLRWKDWLGIAQLTFSPGNSVKKVDDHTFLLKYNDAKNERELVKEMRKKGWITDGDWSLLKDDSYVLKEDGYYRATEAYPVLGGKFLLAKTRENQQLLLVKKNEVLKDCVDKSEEGTFQEPPFTSGYYVLDKSNAPELNKCKKNP